MHPFVSVIIPNYNHAPFLKERMESVLNQTYQHFEVILLDDGSTDNSVDILNHYKLHPKVSGLFINRENSGSAFKQWFKGIQEARGNWIWIAESDDINDPHFLSFLTDKIEDGTVLCFSQSMIINESSEQSAYLGKKIYPNNIYWNDFNERTAVLDGRDFIINHLYHFNQFVNASSVIFKKDAFPSDKLNLLNRFKLCGDWFVWIHIISKGKFCYVHKPLNQFRIHVNTVRNASEAKIFAFFENVIIISAIKKLYSLDVKHINLYTDYLVYIYTNRYSLIHQLLPNNIIRFVLFLIRFSPYGIILLIKNFFRH